MKHSQEERKEIINQIKNSGLSQRKWCEVNNLDRNRLQYWILRLQYLELDTSVTFAETVTRGNSNGVEASE